MGNFRAKLDKLNDRVAEFDTLQDQADSLAEDLKATEARRDKALDEVHALIRELSGMLPTRPEQEQEAPAPLAPPPAPDQGSSSSWPFRSQG